MIAAHGLMRGVVSNRMEAGGGIILAAGGEIDAAVMARILEMIEMPTASDFEIFCV
jgi:hypothetical protein